MDAEKGGEQDGRREARHVTLLLQTMSCGHRQAQAGNPGPRAAGGPAEQRDVALDSYSKSALARVPASSVTGVPLLEGAAADEGAGADYCIQLPNDQEMDAVLEVLACMGSSSQDRAHAARHLELNTENQFAILHATHLLGHRALCRQCEHFVAVHLSEESIVPALRYLETHRSPVLRGACYYWLKQHELPVTRSASRPTPLHVWVDPATGTLNSRSQSVALGGLAEEAQLERRRKARYFVPRALALRDDGTDADVGVGFDGTVKCFVERARPAGDAHAEKHVRFVMRREGGSNPLVMAAQHTTGSSEFVLSLDEEDFTEDGPHFLGKVAGNFLGTQFTLVDFGVPEGSVRAVALPHLLQRRHVVVTYRTNVMGRVPNSMAVHVLVAPVTEQTSESVRKAAATPEARAAVGLPPDGAPPAADLRTRQPRWNPELDAWTMDFKGRVKLASKKNFQLEREGDDRVLMLFGKVSRQRYSLDYQSPMTAVSAFAVALSTFADKLMVT